MASPFNFALTPSMPVTPEGMFPSAQPAAARPGFLQRFQDMRRNNPEALIALGAGMMQGDMAGGFMTAGQQMAKYRERMAGEQQKNKTAEFLSRQYGIPHEDALAIAQNPPLLAQVLKERSAGSDTRYGLNPIYGKDPETGETVLGTMGTDGTFKRIETPGFEISTGVEEMDVGHGIYVRDKRSGQIIQYIPKGGSPSADQRPTGDGGVEPIPGSKLDMERREAAGKADMRRAGQVGDAARLTEDIDRAINIMNSGILPDTGFIGDMLKGVGGTDAANLKQMLDTIGSYVSFDRLNKMRQESPTGGALGNVSNVELDLLKATLGSLNQVQTKDQLEFTLKRLRNMFMEIIHGPQGGQQAPAAPGARRRFNPATGRIE